MRYKANNKVKHKDTDWQNRLESMHNEGIQQLKYEICNLLPDKEPYNKEKIRNIVNNISHQDKYETIKSKQKEALDHLNELFPDSSSKKNE